MCLPLHVVNTGNSPTKIGNCEIHCILFKRAVMQSSRRTAIYETLNKIKIKIEIHKFNFAWIARPYYQNLS